MKHGMTTLRLVVLGAESVGKSAVTVRFLTRRFIGEYNSDKDLLYRSTIKQEDSFIELEILDTCSQKRNSEVPRESHVQWADCFVLVYSICDVKSFEKCKYILKSLQKMKSPFIVPILLLGNKKDLDHRRQVGLDEGHEMAQENSCQFYEVSAAETFMPINIAFQALLKDAKVIQLQKSNILRRRRSSLLNVSRKISAIFGRKDNDVDKKRPSCDVVPDFAMSF
ncbi:hypothetical protein CHS0354_002752 [Potamilus streckersoni]|uniref:small monomeric GTPase n=1 Tax=Potamilus streckersoni TaxID=2493646 RepID=A0AAE0VX53_9BIVA|nr:hypothetical protein CHS0354_002752 [Potamilus streckersoni]